MKNVKLQNHQEQLNELLTKLSDQQIGLIELNQEQIASSWLAILLQSNLYKADTSRSKK